MDVEAFCIAAFSGVARRGSWRFLASEAACDKEWTIAPVRIDEVSLQGLTYKELADATGEKGRTACFALPPGSASVLRALPDFENCDEIRRFPQRLRPGAGTADAPRAFSLRPGSTARSFGLKPAHDDEEPGMSTG